MCSFPVPEAIESATSVPLIFPLSFSRISFFSSTSFLLVSILINSEGFSV